MKKSLTILILMLFLTSSAQAVIDPDPDKIGFFFDSSADITDQFVYPGVPVFVYAIVTNPSAEGITGFEFGYRISVPPGRESQLLRLIDVLPTGAIDLGDNPDPLQGDYVVQLAAPLPPGITLLLVTWQLLLLDFFPADLYLAPPNGSTLGYPVYYVEEQAHGLTIAGACGILDGGGMPSAYINSWCPLPVEAATFGGVKSLYR